MIDCGTESYSVFVTNQLSRCRHGSAESNALVIKISNLVEFPIGSTMQSSFLLRKVTCSLVYRIRYTSNSITSWLHCQCDSTLPTIARCVTVCFFFSRSAVIENVGPPLSLKELLIAQYIARHLRLIFVKS